MKLSLFPLLMQGSIYLGKTAWASIQKTWETIEKIIALAPSYLSQSSRPTTVQEPTLQDELTNKLLDLIGEKSSSLFSGTIQIVKVKEDGSLNLTLPPEWFKEDFELLRQRFSFLPNVEIGETENSIVLKIPNHALVTLFGNSPGLINKLHETYPIIKELHESLYNFCNLECVIAELNKFGTCPADETLSKGAQIAQILIRAQKPDNIWGIPPNFNQIGTYRIIRATADKITLWVKTESEQTAVRLDFSLKTLSPKSFAAWEILKCPKDQANARLHNLLMQAKFLSMCQLAERYEEELNKLESPFPLHDVLNWLQNVPDENIKRTLFQKIRTLVLKDVVHRLDIGGELSNRKRLEGFTRSTGISLVAHHVLRYLPHDGDLGLEEKKILRSIYQSISQYSPVHRVKKKNTKEQDTIFRKILEQLRAGKVVSLPTGWKKGKKGHSINASLTDEYLAIGNCGYRSKGDAGVSIYQMKTSFKEIKKKEALRLIRHLMQPPRQKSNEVKDIYFQEQMHKEFNTKLRKHVEFPNQKKGTCVYTSNQLGVFSTLLLTYYQYSDKNQEALNEAIIKAKVSYQRFMAFNARAAREVLAHFYSLDEDTEKILDNDYEESCKNFLERIRVEQTQKELATKQRQAEVKKKILNILMGSFCLLSLGYAIFNRKTLFAARYVQQGVRNRY
jgi:hypothetical protein